MMRHHLHMPSYFLGTFTEYPDIVFKRKIKPVFQQNNKWHINKKMVVSRQPIFVNLKSNTMKNTLQM